jgi:hypothetical protein
MSICFSNGSKSSFASVCFDRQWLLSRPLGQQVQANVQWLVSSMVSAPARSVRLNGSMSFALSFTHLFLMCCLKDRPFFMLLCL